MKIITLCLCVTLFFCGVASSDEPEKTKFADDGGMNCTITGAVTKPLEVAPNNIIFEYRCHNRGFPEIFIANQYIFKGRTGDNTFEIKYIPSGVMTQSRYMTSSEDLELPAEMKLFFERDSVLPLKITIGDPCKTERKVYLKLITLKGNGLEYQIILPECLKNQIEQNKGWR
jgi:hypothetical protein